MAFRKKAEFILAYNPDILIVPECECPDKLFKRFVEESKRCGNWQFYEMEKIQ